MTKINVAQLRQLVDNERREDSVLVSFWMPRERKAALERTAKRAGISQSGVLRIGEQLAAEALQDA